MPDVTASRTLVKSAPELWTECSDAGALGRHLDGFGDIRITRLEPETAVAWEGEQVCGTVTLEPSGWGTRVVLTATPAPQLDLPAPEVEAPAPEPDPPSPEPVAPEPARRGFFARLFGRRRRAPAPATPPVEVVARAPEPVAAAPVATESSADPQATLLAALDSLGQAHHRPFSRT